MKDKIRVYSGDGSDAPPPVKMSRPSPILFQKEAMSQAPEIFDGRFLEMRPPEEEVKEILLFRLIKNFIPFTAAAKSVEQGALLGKENAKKLFSQTKQLFPKNLGAELLVKNLLTATQKLFTLTLKWMGDLGAGVKESVWMVLSGSMALLFAPLQALKTALFSGQEKMANALLSLLSVASEKISAQITATKEMLSHFVNLVSHGVAISFEKVTQRLGSVVSFFKQSIENIQNGFQKAAGMVVRPFAFLAERAEKARERMAAMGEKYIAKPFETILERAPERWYAFWNLVQERARDFSETTIIPALGWWSDTRKGFSPSLGLKSAYHFIKTAVTSIANISWNSKPGKKSGNFLKKVSKNVKKSTLYVKKFFDKLLSWMEAFVVWFVSVISKGWELLVKLFSYIGNRVLKRGKRVVKFLKSLQKNP